MLPAQVRDMDAMVAGTDGILSMSHPSIQPAPSSSHSTVLCLYCLFFLKQGEKVSIGVRAVNCWFWRRWHSASSTHGAASGAASPSTTARSDHLVCFCWAHGGSRASHWWRPGTSRCLPQQHCISSSLPQPDQRVLRCRLRSCARQAHAVRLQCLHRHPAISPLADDLC